jgi:hypothetical protein
MIRSLNDALTLLEHQRLLPMTSVPPLKCLVDEIAGEHVKGSWWGHKAGKAIFNIASELEDHDDVLSAKLLVGKVTFVHRALWPSMLRVVTDDAWRKRAAKNKQAKLLLVHLRQEHSASGKHVTVVEEWEAWAKRMKVKPKGSFDDAMRILEEAAQGAKLSFGA